MDVPSWHPANQDADATRRQLMAPAVAAPRTEFKVMAGSSADTSTEAGRQLLSDLNGGDMAFGGRGFFDASDRLYLQEQWKVEEAQKSKRKAEEDAQLQSFRSTSLKLQQAQKPLLAVAPDVVGPTKTPGGASESRATVSSSTKKPLSAVVTIKPKKRSAATDAASENNSSKKPRAAKKQPPVAAAAAGAKTENSGERNTVAPQISKPSAKAAAAAAAVVKPAAPATSGSLLLGYSSSSSDSE